MSDFKTPLFKTKCAYVIEGYNTPLSPSFRHTQNHLMQTVGMEGRDSVLCCGGSASPFGSSAGLCLTLCNSVDTSSIIMTFLTADGRGKNSLKKPFSFHTVSNYYSKWPGWWGGHSYQGLTLKSTCDASSLYPLLVPFVNTLQRRRLKFLPF